MRWSPEEAAEFLRTINEETDRLTTLVGNLLDMSRIQAGALQPALRPVALEEVVPSAVLSLGPRAAIVDAQIAETLPPVLADPLCSNGPSPTSSTTPRGCRQPNRRVRVEAGAFDGHIDLRVIDQGPGIPRDQRELVFQPFQRLGDNQAGTGVGLGLAVARGFSRPSVAPSRSMTPRAAAPPS